LDLIVRPGGRAEWGSRRLRCAVGRGGIVREKREGDGGTPVGAWPMRELLYRPDRLERPATRLPARPIARDDGWCDAPGDPAYNRPVRLPFPASAETLWRRDRVYDLVVPLGYNDAPVVPGAGSAIFLHLARRGYEPTAGCVALSRADLLRVLEGCDTHSRVVVEET
jgi:L,D-peptidoglycan transpeptidase YkuD (ErfK/YbiS/YcfS/YnhG family)